MYSIYTQKTKLASFTPPPQLIISCHIDSFYLVKFSANSIRNFLPRPVILSAMVFATAEAPVKKE